VRKRLRERERLGERERERQSLRARDRLGERDTESHIYMTVRSLQNATVIAEPVQSFSIWTVFDLGLRLTEKKCFGQAGPGRILKFGFGHQPRNRATEGSINGTIFLKTLFINIMMLKSSFSGLNHFLIIAKCKAS
jgi:hypothetical protein